MVINEWAHTGVAHCHHTLVFAFLSTITATFTEHSGKKIIIIIITYYVISFLSRPSDLFDNGTQIPSYRDRKLLELAENNVCTSMN